MMRILMDLGIFTLGLFTGMIFMAMCAVAGKDKKD